VRQEGTEVDPARVRCVEAEEESRVTGLHLSLIWGPDVPSEVSYDFRCRFAGGGSSAFPSLLPTSRPICNEFLELVSFQQFAGRLRYPLEPGGGCIPLISAKD
jgi:hypothetical protein